VHELRSLLKHVDAKPGLVLGQSNDARERRDVQSGNVTGSEGQLSRTFVGFPSSFDVDIGCEGVTTHWGRVRNYK
jgi:hypothetical protein